MQLQDSALLRGQVNSEGQLFNYIVTNNPQIGITENTMDACCLVTLGYVEVSDDAETRLTEKGLALYEGTVRWLNKTPARSIPAPSCRFDIGGGRRRH